MNRHRETLMKFISEQNQKIQNDISKQGYKDNSPYKNNPFNIIQGTPQGTPITMDGVSQRLYVTDGKTSKILEPNSGTHFFSGPAVKETALAKYGGLLNKTIKCSNCGWSWKAADGGNDVSTCHKCGEENTIMQLGGTKKPIYVESKNDPRYKAYNDSLTLYNNNLKDLSKNNLLTYSNEHDPKLLKFLKFGKHDVKPKKSVKKHYVGKPNPIYELLYKEDPNDKMKTEDVTNYMDAQGNYITNIDPISADAIINSYGSHSIKGTNTSFNFPWEDDILKRRVAFRFKKPQQEVIVKPTTTKETTKPKPQDKQRPKVEQVKINPQAKELVKDDFNIEAPIPVIRPQAIMPKSFDVTSQRQTMSGPSDYYNYNQQGLSVEQAAEVMRAAEAFNQSIQDKYGNNKNPKAQERYNQLMQNVEVTPNYQLGGTGMMYADRNYQEGGLTKYQKAGTVKKWLGNTLTPEGYITSTTKGGNRISFTGDQRADEWINKQIDSGKFGFDPTTGGTFPLKKPVKGLSKEDQFIGSKAYYDLQAPEGFNSESQRAQIKNLPEFQQDLINAENEKRRKRVVNERWDDAYKNPLFYVPGAIATGGLGLLGLEAAGVAAAPFIQGALATQLPGLAAVPGATVGNAITAGFAGHGLANIAPDTVEMYKNPTWGNAGSLAMDALEIAPIVGPAGKMIGEGVSATRKALTTQESALAKLQDIRNIAPEVDYANPIKDIATTFKNRNKKLLTVGAENLDKELLKKITQLESSEGFNRLVAQEAEMLKRDFPNLVNLENKAVSNAHTRISELYQTALEGNFNRNYLEAKKLNPKLTPNEFGIPRNNAFFRPGLGSSNFSDNVIDLSKANSPAQLKNNIFAKELYGIEMPGEIAIGREYAEGMPVYDHEINHALQNSRNTALDDMLRKYFNNSENLLKDFSQKTNKAYNYFRKSKHGVPSKEPSSFLAEARRAMLDRGLIKDIYEPITPKKVFDAMKHFKIESYKNPYTEQSYHRIFDFANDSPQTLKFLSNAFNKLPVILPVGLATGATAVGLPTEKQGGVTRTKQQDPLSWFMS